jgi:hypothetical protein
MPEMFGPLVAVAVRACRSEVRKRRLAAVLFSNDVIDLSRD